MILPEVGSRYNMVIIKYIFNILIVIKHVIQNKPNK
jgi:hypothetical protein